MSAQTKSPVFSRSLTAVGLFAGIGGVEQGFRLAGHETRLLCEIDPHAQVVLRHHFPEVKLTSDVTALKSLPTADIVAAGFPCQDLSQAGRTRGITGEKSGLVGEVFRLLKTARRMPTWLVLENVPFMLQLERGRGMRQLIRWLEELSFHWAYRVVDARAFGVPQRRLRVILVASRTEDPREVLFADESEEAKPGDHQSVACGFYWTEGIRGLGWAVDAVPTLKGGSTIGIPSPPGIRLPRGESIVVPSITDVERLQGFEADWTLPAVDAGGRKGVRWRLVGNAVNVRVSEWLGKRLMHPGHYDHSADVAMAGSGSCPHAGWGGGGQAFEAKISHWPVSLPQQPLIEFIRNPSPLSYKAAAGFLSRTTKSSLRFPEGFLDAVADHVRRMKP